VKSTGEAEGGGRKRRERMNEKTNDEQKKREERVAGAEAANDGAFVCGFSIDDRGGRRLRQKKSVPLDQRCVVGH